MDTRKKILISVIVAVVLLVGTFVGGFMAGRNSVKSNISSNESTADSSQTITATQTTTAQIETTQSNSQTTVANNSNSSNAGGAALKVKGTTLTDGSGNVIQLKGVSTHGISWFPDYVNYDAFKSLKEDWGANVVRLAMYPAEYNGYLTGGDQNALKQLVKSGVDYATQLGMYVIIDWHVLNYAPNMYTNEAVAFFNEMSSQYRDNPYVIYEVCNEPCNANWSSVIKPYAEQVISTIRANGSKGLVLVGTNTWSQDIQDVIGNEINDDNVMYTMHFYAATHKDDLRNRLQNALNSGVPVFVSECGICDASGNGGLDYGSADAWLKLMNDNKISFVAWSLCNKAESSALINPGCSKFSGWADGDLTDSGRWYKSAISK